MLGLYNDYIRCEKMISLIGSILFCTYIVLTCFIWSLNVIYLAHIPIAIILLLYAKIFKYKCKWCNNHHHYGKYTYNGKSIHPCYGCSSDCASKSHHLTPCTPANKRVYIEGRTETIREQIGTELVDEPIYDEIDVPDTKLDVIYYQKPVTKTRYEYKQTGTKQVMYDKYSTFEPIYEYVPIEYTDHEPSHRIETIPILKKENIIIGYKKVEKPIYNTFTRDIPGTSYIEKCNCECKKCSCSRCNPKTVEKTCFDCTCDVCVYIKKLQYNIDTRYPCHISCGIFVPMIHSIVILFCIVANILIYVNYNIHVSILIISIIFGILNIVISFISIC